MPPRIETHRSVLSLLLRAKARSTWNRVIQSVRESPIRPFAAIALIGVIWLGLYFLFYLVFRQFRRMPLEATVAIPLVFNYFFVAMLALLSFSNAIIVYGSLFSKGESAFLLAAPVTPLDLVTLKYLESVFLASWSFVLLGVPLMLAIAHLTEAPSFYLLFLAFFLAFIPIPGALGVLLAWAAASFFPRRAIHIITAFAAILLSLLALLAMRWLRLGDAATEEWLRSFLAQMSIVQASLLPNHWVAKGIDHAIHNQLAESLLYLCVTFANAVFFSWVAVRFVAHRLDRAYDRASAAGGSLQRRAVEASGGLSGLIFAYLPAPLRLIAAKDMRTFFRDPLQWSQLAILFGLLVLYLTNMPSLRFQYAGTGWYLIIPFLNLCAVSLILATFTCRFVFPLISLEGQKLWLVGLMPLSRGRILIAKFAFAMTVTLMGALLAMGLAVYILELRWMWAVIHLAETVAICFGLCGLSVGLGARMPMFHQTNVARIANGFGGTTNLLISVALVAVVLFLVGSATWRGRNLADNVPPDTIAIAQCVAAGAVSMIAGTAAMILGARHFSRVEA